MAFHDLRGFLQRLDDSGGLLRVIEPIDPNLESTALCQGSLLAEGSALLFANA